MSSWRSSATTERLAVARVIGAKGLGGGLRVELLTDWPERLVVDAELYVEDEDAPRRIRGAEWGGRLPVLMLEGVDDRESAERLTGRHLERAVEPLPEGEYYWHQLEGISVEHVDGRSLGRVAEVLRVGETEVYVVEQPDGGELLVPALREVVRELDVPGRRMVIDHEPA
jgi:16S rRNA processing protein RimM